MKKKVLATTMTVLVTVSLAACGGNAKETTTADTAAVATAEEKAEDTTAAENKDETSVEAVKTGAAKEVVGGRLTMATDAELPPYEYYDGGAVVGIDTEIAKTIADELGMEPKIEDIAFDSAIPEIVSGRADMDLIGTTVTEDRIQSVDFSSTYVEVSRKIIVTEDSEIASPDDLKDVTVGVQLETADNIYVSDLEADGTTVERYNKGSEAVQALSQGKVDAAVIDGEPAKTFVAETQGLKILDESFIGEEYAVAVKKGNTELLEKVSGALKILKGDGTLNEVVAKYIGAE